MTYVSVIYTGADVLGIVPNPNFGTVGPAPAQSDLPQPKSMCCTSPQYLRSLGTYLS